MRLDLDRGGVPWWVGVIAVVLSAAAGLLIVLLDGCF